MWSPFEAIHTWTLLRIDECFFVLLFSPPLRLLSNHHIIINVLKFVRTASKHFLCMLYALHIWTQLRPYYHNIKFFLLLNNNINMNRMWAGIIMLIHLQLLVVLKNVVHILYKLAHSSFLRWLRLRIWTDSTDPTLSNFLHNHGKMWSLFVFLNRSPLACHVFVIHPI